MQILNWLGRIQSDAVARLDVQSAPARETTYLAQVGSTDSTRNETCTGPTFSRMTTTTTFVRNIAIFTQDEARPGQR